MKKVKKFIMVFLIFMLGIMNKVYALITPLYGPGNDQTITFEPTLGEKIAKVFTILSPILLFIIGLFVVINKRTPKIVKSVIITIFIILVIFVIFVTLVRPLIDFIYMYVL